MWGERSEGSVRVINNMTSEAESLLVFPCEFPIKVMGKCSATFEAQVIDIMRRHVPDLDETTITHRPSQGGNYLAITVTIQAASRAQLDAIYQDLTACKDVLMAL